MFRVQISGLRSGDRHCIIAENAACRKHRKGDEANSGAPSCVASRGACKYQVWLWSSVFSACFSLKEKAAHSEECPLPAYHSLQKNINRNAPQYANTLRLYRFSADVIF